MAAPMAKTKTFRKGNRRPNTGKKGRISKPSIKKKQSIQKGQRGSSQNIKVTGSWKSVDIDYNLFSPEELTEFDGVEELTDYELVRELAREDSPDSDGDNPGETKTTDNSDTNGKKRKQKSEQKKSKKKAKLDNVKEEKESDDEETGIAEVTGQILRGSHDEDDSEEEGSEEDSDNEIVESEKRTKVEKKKGKDKEAKAEQKIEQLATNKDAQNKQNVKSKKEQKKQKSQKGKQQQLKPVVGDDEKGSYTKGLHVAHTDQDLDMSAWDELSLPKPILQALQDLGFTKPTPIQAQCIPSAIEQCKDILGAAETGSGKTLAFGIPMLSHILRLKARQQRLAAKAKKSDLEDMDQEEEMTASDAEEDIGNADESGEEDSHDEEEQSDQEQFDSDDIGSEEELQWEDENSDGEADKGEDNSQDGAELEEDGKDNRREGAEEEEEDDANDEPVIGDGLLGLVMTPTRELAVQVKNHLVAAAKYIGIKIAVVVGGVSAEKQQRLLKKKPEVIVGTPGRLWELFLEREPHLSTLAHTRFLVIDEADRMVERGHYIELSNIMDLINGSDMKERRQNFIFSATLTMVHIGPKSMRPTKNDKDQDKTKLDNVLAKVTVRQNAKVVDLTSKEGTVSTLLEGKIVCNLSEKDIYLYYFLLQYPGRTLVFTNSIESIRRMISIFNLLQCNPLPLHSSMHQRQRLKNLDRFAANPKGLMIATDVAARGLDIPNVQNVIHYHVPKTSEIYVHRSGRTARQSKEGLSIMLVQAQEVKCFRKVCKGLNRDDLLNFPTELKYYEAVTERVDLARQIDKMELSATKKQKTSQWYENAAKEMDIELDDWIKTDIAGDSEKKQHNSHVRELRGELKDLIHQKIFPRWSSQLYPTLDGALVQPFKATDSKAAMTSFKTKIKKDQTDDKARKEKKRQKFRKFKRNQKFSKAKSAGKS